MHSIYKYKILSLNQESVAKFIIQYVHPSFRFLWTPTSTGFHSYNKVVPQSKNILKSIVPSSSTPPLPLTISMDAIEQMKELSWLMEESDLNEYKKRRSSLNVDESK